MNDITRQKNYWVIGIRWAARIYGGLLAVFVLTIAVGEGGPPNPFTQPLPVAIELFGMLSMLVGCIIVWRWRGVAALLTIGGIMIFHIIEKRLLLMGAFPWFDLAGIFFLVSWLLEKLQGNGEVKDA